MIDNVQSKPPFSVKQFDNSSLDVYDAKPLLDASIELFGTEKKRRYHLIPELIQFVQMRVLQPYRAKKGFPLKEGEAHGVWSPTLQSLLLKIGIFQQIYSLKRQAYGLKMIVKMIWYPF